MNKDEIFREYLKSENNIDEYGYRFCDYNLHGIKKKFYEKAGLSDDITCLKLKSHKRKARLGIWIAASLIICIMSGAIALGILDVSPIFDAIKEKNGRLVKNIDPEKTGDPVAQPAYVSKIYDGIEIQTLAAICDSDTVYLYFTVRDLTEDRIDETILIDDLIYILDKETQGTCRLISFDGETKTATMMMTISSSRKMLSGRTITLIINSILSGAEKHEYDTGLEISEILSGTGVSETEVISYEYIRYRYGVFAQDLTAKEYKILKKGGLSLKIPGLDWLEISNIGFMDGKFRIQIKLDKNLDRNRYESIFLADPDNNAVYQSRGYFGFTADPLDKTSATTLRVSDYNYIEYLFDISDVKELDRLKLVVKYSEYERMITGKWEDKITVRAYAESREIKTSISIGRATIEKVILSPLGVTVIVGVKTQVGNELSAIYDTDLIINYKNGGTDRFSLWLEHYNDNTAGQYNLKFSPANRLIDVESIESITIDGITISLGE